LYAVLANVRDIVAIRDPSSQCLVIGLR
jgi:hypothetical protein